jgi:hypothetical protein
VTEPLTKAELLALPPVVNLATLGRVLGLSEPTIRERHRKGELGELGIRVLQLGAQYRVPTADVLNLLGISASEAGQDVARPGPQDRIAVKPVRRAGHAVATQEPP